MFKRSTKIRTFAIYDHIKGEVVADIEARNRTEALRIYKRRQRDARKGA